MHGSTLFVVFLMLVNYKAMFVRCKKGLCLKVIFLASLMFITFDTLLLSTFSKFSSVNLLKMKFKTYEHRKLTSDEIDKLNHSLWTEQIERKQKLKNYCEKSMRIKFIQSGLTIYSTREKILFCAIPKAASTTWKRMFQLFEANIDAERVLALGKQETHLQNYSILNNLPATIKQQIFDTYYSFLISRHPFERLVSTYRNKFEDPYSTHVLELHGENILRMFRSNLTATEKQGYGVRFGEFIRYIIRTRIFDSHWERMVKLCPPCLVPYKYLAKMESLVEDSQMILVNAGLDDRYSFLSNSMDRYQKLNRQTMKVYFRNVSREEIRELYQIYKDDFKAFGYQIPDYLKRK